MRFAKKGLVGLLTLILLIVPINEIKAASRQSDSPYRHAAHEAALYLTRQTLPDGKFVYYYNPYFYKSAKGYSIVRHAGAVYAMYEEYGYSGDPKILQAADRALNYLKDQIKPCPNYADSSCVIADQEIDLGSNALTILAITEQAKVTGSTVNLATAESLARYITHTQTPDGKFSAQFANGLSGEPSDMVSPYYPGEATFGLSRLYQLDHNQAWLQTAKQGVDYLINVRDKNGQLLHDHWLLYSMNELDKLQPNVLYQNHTRVLVDSITAIQHPESGSQPDWAGGYYDPPRTTPTATRSEGLNAAYRMFIRAHDQKYADKALTALKRGVAFQLKNQLTEEKIIALGADPNALGGFLGSFTEHYIRIDYNQHDMSSLVGLDRILSGKLNDY